MKVFFFLQKGLKQVDDHLTKKRELEGPLSEKFLIETKNRSILQKPIFISIFSTYQKEIMLKASNVAKLKLICQHKFLL